MAGHDGLLYRFKRWMYPGDRPDLLARFLNRVSVIQFASGLLAPRNRVVLEVRGRRTGRLVALPVDRRAPLEDYPVFRIVREEPHGHR